MEVVDLHEEMGNVDVKFIGDLPPEQLKLISNW